MDFVEERYINGQIFYIYKDERGMFVNGPKPSRKFLINNRNKESQRIEKKDSDKPRLDLISSEFTMALGKVLDFGATKYGEDRGELPNYLKDGGFHYSKLIASALRHLHQFKMGIDNDDETSQSHLAHCAANLMMLYDYSLTKKGIDDRIKKEDL